MKARICVLAMISLTVLWIPAYSAVGLNLGKAEGRPGETVTIPLTLTLSGELPVGLSSNSLDGGFFTYDPKQMKFAGAEKGSDLAGADITLVFTEPSPGKITFQIMDNTLRTLPAGEIAVLKFTLLKGPRCLGHATVGLHSNVACADAETHEIPVTVGEGSISIQCGPQQRPIGMKEGYLVGQ